MGIPLTLCFAASDQAAPNEPRSKAKSAARPHYQTALFRKKTTKLIVPSRAIHGSAVAAALTAGPASRNQQLVTPTRASIPDNPAVNVTAKHAAVNSPLALPSTPGPTIGERVPLQRAAPMPPNAAITFTEAATFTELIPFAEVIVIHWNPRIHGNDVF
jgi:hypothetical protein